MENRKIKILAIDDIQDNLISLKAFIQDIFPEAQMLLASSGAIGLEIAAIEKPDVILLDIIMPGMDGFEVCRNLKSDKELCDIPVVFMTAIKGDKDSRIKALECGGDAFLSKPIDESELTAQIRAMLKINAANIEKRNEKVRLAALVYEQTNELLRSHSATLSILEDLRNENIIRAKIERELRQSEEKYRTIFENVQDVFYHTDLDGTILEISPSIAQLSEYDRDELISKSVLMLYNKPDEREVLLNSILRNGDLLDYELELKTKSDQVRNVSINARLIQDEEGRPIQMDGVIRDITDRRQTVAKLKESEEFSRYLLQTIPFGMDIVDEQGTVLFQSDNLKKHCGEEAIGSKCWDVYRDDKKQCANCPLIDGIKVGKTKAYESAGLLGGKTFEVIYTGMIYEGKKALLEIFVDITDRKQAEQELIKARDHAQESDRLKSAFLANMSHEFRTPMNGILGFAELLKMPGLTGDQQQEYISIIETSGERMLNIINNVVDISKIETGQVAVNFTQTNINEPIAFVSNFLEPEARLKGVQLMVSHKLADDLATINTDREKLYSILTSLVQNAIKFTDRGTIQFGYLLKGEFLEFYIKDKGIGIPENRQKAIFERFIQADISDKRAFQGAGLGLSISKAYVEMLGGKIWVESYPGIGSTFYFTVPYSTGVVHNSDIKNDIPAKTSVKESKKLNVLVVEDDVTSERLITLAIKMISKEIVCVNTGHDAVDTCRRKPDIDLILMDIKMPGMDGYEAARQIREFNKDVIIIAQTAYGLSNDGKKALDNGCNDYISKPLKISLLRQMIQRHFN